MRRHTFSSFSKHLIVAGSLGLVFSGCSMLKTDTPTIDEQLSLLNQDFNALFVDSKFDKPLSLYDALAMGIYNNLDVRLQEAEKRVGEGEVALEALNAIPDVSLRATATGRDSPRTSFSASTSDGAVSTDSSTSSDQYGRTVTLESSWDLLDTGLTYVRTQQLSNREKVTSERRRKVMQDIINEVRVLYWRAGSAQIMQTRIQSLTDEGKNVLSRLEKVEEAGVMERDAVLKRQANLLRALNTLVRIKGELAEVKAILAAKLNIPPGTDFEVDVQSNDFFQPTNIPIMSQSMQDLVLMALLLRPEMREELLNKRIAEDEYTNEILRTLPGLELIVSKNYDSNSFLENSNWLSFSAGLVQNLVNIFTLPSRLDQKELQAELAALRRQAVASSVMSQVYLSSHRLDSALERYEMRVKEYTLNERIIQRARSKRRLAILTRSELVEIEADIILSNIQSHYAFIDAQSAYANLLTSVGVDPFVSIRDFSSLDVLKEELETKINRIQSSDFTTILETIRSARENGDYATLNRFFDESEGLRTLQKSVSLMAPSQAQPKPVTIKPVRQPEPVIEAPLPEEPIETQSAHPAPKPEPLNVSTYTTFTVHKSNIRSAPWGDIINVYASGIPVEVRVTDSKWYEIVRFKIGGQWKTPGNSGFIHASNLKLQAGETVQNDLFAYTTTRRSRIRNAPGGDGINVFAPEIKLLGFRPDGAWVKIFQFYVQGEWQNPTTPHWIHISNLQPIRQGTAP